MSLKLYYTGAIKFDQSQTEPIKSLGGFISSTEVPNGLLGNLFGDLSRFTVMQGKAEIRVFAIKNTAVVTKANLKCWFTYPNNGSSDTNDCEYDVGFAVPTVDDCGDLQTEAISSIYATPYTTLNSGKVGEVNALAIGNLDAGDYLCIFVRRKIKASAQQPMSDADLLAVLDGSLVLPKVEDIQLSFGWD